MYVCALASIPVHVYIYMCIGIQFFACVYTCVHQHPALYMCVYTCALASSPVHMCICVHWFLSLPIAARHMDWLCIFFLYLLSLESFPIRT